MTTTRGGLPSSRGLWLRWSWRDLRRHWVAVVAIALVLAIGTGVYAGLGSTATWRRLSNDASFDQLAMHDLRVELSPGTFVDEGTLAAGIATMPDADSVVAAHERLVVDSQVDATAGDESVLAVARLVGMPLGETGVDELWITDGDAPDPGGGAAGGDAVLETKFADHHGLAPSGSFEIAGGHTVDYTALGTAPEDFFYEGPEGAIFSEGDLAIVYLPLASAQGLVGRDGAVNDLVVRLADGADRDRVRDQLIAAVDAVGVSATVTDRDDATAVRVLYEDIDNDQRLWNVLSGLVLFAAALAAFNLISRIVEAQRREIGIGMALGVPRRRLAVRPLLVGAQVALLGTVAGVGVGLLVGGAMRGLLESVLPLPAYRTPFQAGVYARAAALGVLVPVVASALPVLRAVRVEPIEAIRTGHLSAKTSRLTDWTGRIRLPGTSLTQLPLRNVLRTPRRTVLTAVGVGVAITALVGVLGLLDSVNRTMERAGDELTKGDPERVLVQLDGFHDVGSEAVAAVADAPAVGRTDVALRLPVTAHATDATTAADDELDLLVELLDLDGAAWSPTIERAVPDGAARGVVLADKAASDLGVGLGDPVVLRHPTRRAGGGFTLTESELVVSAIHANPIRTFAYLDLARADRFGLAGTTNLLDAYPAAGFERADVQREVFGLDGVASSQAVGRIREGFDEAMTQIVGILAIAAVAVVSLALLIAFNATRITVEERRREHATMRAFGLPVRTVLALVVKESVLIGVAATAIGVATGFVFIGWMLQSLGSTTLPDLGMSLYVAPATLVIAAIVGVLAVAAAPLFLVRRVSRMDIPDTLRVME
ncbi:MAG: FtsX-like permease family protein [Actinomycetota bacterium]|nr:FtsX-like permease family protein [Actinomycetota bacterium]